MSNLPTIQDLHEANPIIAYKNEQLNLILNQEPKKDWVKEHPFIKGYKYVPIDKIEFMLRKIFKKFSIEITGQGTSFNGVWVSVRVHYYHPTEGEMLFHDGIGAIQLQTAKGTSPSDLVNINQGALSMAYPHAKTLAIKDACDHFGKLFGCDLNRRDTLSYPVENNPADLLQSIIDLFELKKAYLEPTLVGSIQRVIDDKEVNRYATIHELLKSK